MIGVSLPNSGLKKSDRRCDWRRQRVVVGDLMAKLSSKLSFEGSDQHDMSAIGFIQVIQVIQDHPSHPRSSKIHSLVIPPGHRKSLLTLVQKECVVPSRSPLVVVSVMDVAMNSPFFNLGLSTKRSNQ